MGSKLTIFVVDDDPEIRTSFRWLFESVNLSVETYDSAISFLDTYDPTRQGCLILDVRMPIMSGLELLDLLKLQKNCLPIFVITKHGDIEMAVRAMKAGAIDFLTKPINNQNFLDLVQKTLYNHSFNNVETHNAVGNRIHSLTEREHQVLGLVLEGKLNKEIAHFLKISISTVEAHRAKIMHKMQAKNATELVKFCLKNNYENC
jgi:FixJ family two-component response regulator